MSDKLQLRRGTTAQHASFIGSEGEVTVDTDDKELVLHDGITPGGKRQASKQSVLDLVDVVAGNKEDLELESISTEPDFKGRIETNRRKFAGSGFVEWGKHSAGAFEETVGEGLYTFGTQGGAFVNAIGMSRKSDTTGVSLTDFAMLNVDGALLNIDETNNAGFEAYNGVIIKLPPAPDGLDKADGTGRFADLAEAIAAGGTALNASVVDRQDLVGLEVWYEAMSTNDVFNPYGNTQFGVSTYEGISLTNSFIAQPYSAFGEWDTNTAGYHKQWSAMAATEKAIALSDHKNNLFFSRAANDYIQIKYRIRSIAGLGPEWEFVDVTTDGYLKFSLGANGDGVLPRGGKTSAQDFVGSDSALAYYASKSSGLNLDNQEHAAFTVRNDGVGGVNPEDYAHEGKCYFIPIALVSRRNQGAYHPVLNPNGSAGVVSVSGTASNTWFDSAARKIETIADSFNPHSGATNPDGIYSTGASKGNIGSTSRRPDGKFYDAIYEGDVEDLRISARRKAKSDLREEFKRKAIANEVRGFETESQWEVVSVVVEDAADATTSYFAADPNASFTVGEFVLGKNGDDVFYGYVRIVGGTYIAVSTTRNEAFANTSTASFNRTQGATTTIYRLKESLNFKELLQCDVIGDPANYFSGQDYTDTGAGGSITVSFGDVIKITDPSPVGSTQVGAFYRRIGGTTTITLSSFDYEVSTNYANLGTTYDGQTWTNDGTSQTVDLAVDDIVYLKSGGVGGTSGHYYRLITGAGTTNLNAKDYSDSSLWADLGRKYRGQQWTNDGASQSVNLTSGDVVYQAVSPVNGGTAGHFYARVGNTTGTDLAFTDYTNDTIWTDLGPDWNGSPAAGSWLQDGIPGFPLLTHADTGASLIPDGTSQDTKASRKVKDFTLALRSLDNGVTWIDDTAGWQTALESSTNARAAALSTGNIWLLFYLTDAHFTEEANNSVVDDLGDVYASSDQYPFVGNALLSSLISKVATNNSDPRDVSLPLSSFRVQGDTAMLNANVLSSPKHGQIELLNPDGSPAIKVLDYLSHENGRYYLNLLAVELGWKVYGLVTDVTDGYSGYTKGNLYRVTQTNCGVQKTVVLCTLTFAGPTPWSDRYVSNDGVIRTADGDVENAFILYDGTGWGDDKEFSVIDGTDVKTDLNGNTRLVTQQRFALPYLTGEDS